MRHSPGDRGQNAFGARRTLTKKMPTHSYSGVLERIQAAIDATKPVFARFTPGEIEAEYKVGHDPVTEADRSLDAVLRTNLLQPGEGWLSEESADDLSRLDREWVWVVDPLDGTREFVAGIPEFCVSVAMIHQGQPVAGGIFNPATNETFFGALDFGLTYNGQPARASHRTSLEGALVLASRSETKRGEWQGFRNAPFKIEPMGSVAYKLARVSAGLADLTFTLCPKHEWDVAGGAALVASSGGFVQTLDSPFIANRKDPLITGLIAGGPNLRDELLELLIPYLQPASRK
jgi:myo-inositol-1(or 4)-monophosphatase